MIVFFCATAPAAVNTIIATAIRIGENNPLILRTRLFFFMNVRTRNGVLNSLARILAENKSEIIAANKGDLEVCPPDDPVIIDRLKVNEPKVDAMIRSVLSVAEQPD